MNDLILNVPPNSPDAETAIVGIGLIDADAVVMTGIQASDFYDGQNALLFRTIAELHAAGNPVDGVTVSELLSSKGQLPESGGFVKLHSVLEHGSEFLAQTAHVEHYAGIVRSKRVLRDLVRFGSELARQAFDPGADADELLTKAAATLQNFEGTSSTGLVDLVDSVSEVITEIQRRIETGDTCRILTGFRDLDLHLGGFRAGQLIVLAARPGLGKTGFALNIAGNVAKSGTPVLFASFEMTHAELTERFLSAESDINLQDITSGTLTRPQIAKLQQVERDVIRDRFFYADPNADIERVIQQARQAVRRNHVGFVVVDYLQLIESTQGRNSNREQAVSAVSRGLKRLAMECRIPVLALSQLNRDVEKREDKRPKLADLRESGAIEQDANIVTFLHRPDVYDAEDRPGVAEVVIAKNRQGPTGIVSLMFQREYCRFSNYVQLFNDIDIPENF